MVALPNPVSSDTSSTVKTSFAPSRVICSKRSNFEFRALYSDRLDISLPSFAIVVNRNQVHNRVHILSRQPRHTPRKPLFRPDNSVGSLPVHHLRLQGGIHTPFRYTQPLCRSRYRWHSRNILYLRRWGILSLSLRGCSTGNRDVRYKQSNSLLREISDYSILSAVIYRR